MKYNSLLNSSLVLNEPSGSSAIPIVNANLVFPGAVAYMNSILRTHPFRCFS
jgi:hypothetical protein